MNPLLVIIVTMALLGAALVGGMFFAFSSFVMKALSRVPAAAGMAAMQSINVAVINPSFLGAFVGTTVLSSVVAGLALWRPDHPSAMFFLAGAAFYLGGTFLATMLGNVPLNNRLSAVSATAPGAPGTWRHYLRRWTLWNHLRSVAAMLAALLYTVGLTQIGAA